MTRSPMFSRLGCAMLAVSAALLAAGVEAAEPQPPVAAARGGAIGQSAAPSAAPAGSVNLEGFNMLGTLRPMQGTIEAFPPNSVRIGRADPARAAPGAPAVEQSPLLGDPKVRSGFAGYQVRDPASPDSGYGVNLQFENETDGRSDRWRVQPGVDYSRTLSPSINLTSRLFSTWGHDSGASTTAPGASAPLGADHPTSDSGLRDVGVSLGFDYSLSDNWLLQTQATYARQLGSPQSPSPNVEEQTPHQFFGGVVVNYKF